MSNMTSEGLDFAPQDNLLNCPICMDVFKTPRMLPCQHTLCDSCLRAYLVNKNMSRVLVMDFPCPVCRTPTPAPKTYKPLEEWAGLFPLNHLIVSLLDGRGRVIFEALKKQEPQPSQERETCPHHPGKEVDFFCTDHDLPICSKCFKNTHRHCNVNDIEDQIEFQERQAGVSTDIDNVQKYLDEAMQAVRTNITDLSKQRDTYYQEVQDFICKIETFLQRFKTESSNKLNTNHDLGIANLQEQYGRLERFKEAVSRSEKTLKTAAAATNMVQSLKELARVESEVKTHISTIQLNHAEINSVRLEFKLCGKLDPFLASLEQLSKPKVEVLRTVPNLTTPPTLSEQGSVDKPSEEKAAVKDAPNVQSGQKNSNFHIRGRQECCPGKTNTNVMTEKPSIKHKTSDKDVHGSQNSPGNSLQRTRAVSDASIDYTLAPSEDTESTTEQRPGMTFTRQLSQPVFAERTVETVRQIQERLLSNSHSNSNGNQNFDGHERSSDSARSNSQESTSRSAPRLLRERRAVKTREIQTRVSSDKKECNITGSTSMPDGKLILVDCNNCKIKLFSKDFIYQSCLEFDREPWNVVATSPHEIAVTVPLEKTVHLVRVQGSLLTEVRCIDTRKECWGITQLDGKLVVTAKDDGSWVLFLDKSGRELMAVNFTSHENPSILRPVSITTAASGQMMYVSCEGQSGTKGALVSLTPSGEVKNVYTHWSLDKPYSSSVDREGNVYVHGMRSSNVHLVSAAGERVKILLTTQDSISRPQHIRFLTGTDSFLLTERRLDTGSVYEMK